MKKSLKTVKILAAAAFTGTMLIGSPAHSIPDGGAPTLTGKTYTTDTALNESMKSKTNTTPTIDHLKANNPNITGVESTWSYDDDTTATYHYSTDYTITTGSGYHYDNVGEQEQESVTFWDVNKSTGEMTPSYYNARLNQTEYGTTDGDTVKYYEPNSDYTRGGLYQEVETPSGNGSTITVRYNASDVRTEQTTRTETSYYYGGETTHNYTGTTLINDEGKTIDEVKDIFNDTKTTDNYTSTYTYNDVTTTTEGSRTYSDISVNNSGTINTINSLFTENGETSVYNKGTIGNITSSFVNNSKSYYGYAGGGAVYNATNAEITGISSAFIGNTIGGYTAHGGAIFNWGTIGDITGTFSGNLAYSPESGNVYNPYTESYETTSESYGGAIFNEYIIDNITADFIGNEAVAQGYANGGAIYNYGNIGNITGDFIRNKAIGMAATEESLLTSTGDGIEIARVAASSTMPSGEAFGGAIQNVWYVGNITGDFTENAALGGEYSSGGAIYNYGEVGNVAGDFTGNSAVTTTGDAQGGAISNDNIIGHISGDFTKNAAVVVSAFGYGYDNRVTSVASGVNTSLISYYIDSYGDAKGGAISNTSTITDITGDFSGNNAASNGAALGGAIYNIGAIGKIAGDFVSNTATDLASTTSNVADWYYDAVPIAVQSYAISNAYSSAVQLYGGAIANYADYDYDSETTYTGSIDSVEGNFTGNYLEGSADIVRADGGAILNDGEIGNITGNFTNNNINITGVSAEGYGGAIGNAGTIDGIKGEFSGNSVISNGVSSSSSDGSGNTVSVDIISGAAGGAIYNGYPSSVSNSNDTSTITEINGSFTNNHVEADTVAIGGAIANTGIIGGTNSDKVLNVTTYHLTTKIEETGETVKVYGASAESSVDFDTYGITNQKDFVQKALDNGYKINVIDYGDITDNDEFETDSISQDGLAEVTAMGIASTEQSPVNTWGLSEDDYAKTLGIEADFTGNHAVSENGSAIGGAVYNSGYVYKINGDFKNNYAKGYDAKGGAIYNARTATATATSADTKKEALASGYHPTIAEIKGDFTGNYAEGTDYAQGGAISNSGLIEKITGNFTDNHAKSNDTSYGGAISNCGEINSVTGNFTGNSAEGVDAAYGGAIDNIGGTINIVNSNFINNYAKSENETYGAKGGAIANINGTAIITADNFDSKISGNYTEVNGVKDYVAISNADKNVAPAGNSYLTLKAVNNGSITLDDKITGTDNINNDRGKNTSTVTLTGDSTGTLNIYNDITDSDIKAESNVKVNFANDTLHDYNMSKVTSADTVRYGIDVDLDNLKADTITTANVSSGVVTLEAINYINEEVREGEYKVQVLKTPTNALQLALADGLVSDEDILLQEKIDITDDIKTDANWKDSYTVYTKTTDIYGTMGLATTDTDNDSIGVTISSVKEYNSQDSAGDTIKAWAEQETPTTTDSETGETVNVDRNFNFDSSDDTYKVTEDLGNPSAGVLNINGKTDDEGNHSTIDLDGKKGFDITEETTLNIKDTTLTGSETVLTVESGLAEVNLDNATLDGNIETGDAQYQMGITGDTQLNGSVGKADVQIGYAKDPEHPEDDAEVDKINNNTIVGLNSYNNFEKADVTAYGGTIDLINDKAEQQLAQSFTVEGNTIFNIDADLANVSMDRLPENTTVKDGAMINVNQINLVSDSKGEKTVIPFAYDSFKNSVDYIGPEELSKETQVTTAFAPIYKYGVSYNKDDGMFTFLRGAGNSSNTSDAFNPAVLASPVAAQAGALTAQTMAFNYAFRHADTYMPLPSADRFAMKNYNKFASTSYENVDLRVDDLHDRGIWVQPYASFEDVKLKNGPKVDTITYGTMVGGDSDFKELKNGWGTIFTGYAGYSGSSQSYGGVDTYQNGGLLGATQTFYKKNFFTALTVSAGAMVGESHTMYGHDNFTSLMAGVASKSGYNLEFKDGKFIIQPTMMMSYTFINTFDYTNAAGVRINSDPLHAIQLNPNIRFIANTKHGWQPYASVGMVWNLMDDTKVTANDVRLPEMSVKPYVEYGLGVQKRWNDKFTGFGQVMVRNGGRTGVALTAGFRWALGKEGKPIEKTQRSNGNFNASLPTQNRFISSDVNGKNWASSNEKTTFGRPMGSAANIPNDERPQNVFGL